MNTLLELKHLRKQFGGLVAVNSVALAVEKGEILGLLGPNGSGKSTVMNLISGALAVTSGEILLDGRPIEAAPAHLRTKLGISRTFQLVRLAPSLSALDNVVLSVAFGRKPAWGQTSIRMSEQALEQVGLGGKGNLPVDSLNYIDQKRLELARAIAPQPDILLLDEWLAGLNPTELRTGIELVRSLSQTGITIILVEHIMEAVRELCPRCAVMNAGTLIADGATEKVLSNPQVISAYLGDYEYA